MRLSYLGVAGTISRDYFWRKDLSAEMKEEHVRLGAQGPDHDGAVLAVSLTMDQVHALRIVARGDERDVVDFVPLCCHLLN